MPKYGMERIQNVYTNLQYPKRLLSSVIQRDFKTTKNETIRFLTNTTIGLGGMFDPAERFLKIEMRDKCMDEALAKCKIKQGPYLVMPYLVSTSIAGIIAQRLVRKICPKCRQAYEATSYEKQVLGVDEDKPLTLYKGKGCGYCNNTGYSGRTGVYEVMEVTRKLKEAITSHKTMDEIRDISVQNGMSSLGDECKKLVLDGVTTMNKLATITILKEI